MGSKERKTRLKNKLCKDILSIAMVILKNEGRQSLSLRKIADRIEYSAPTIYSHYKNKQALLTALCRVGYKQLNLTIQKNCAPVTDPAKRLTVLLQAYWNFAMEERELYQLMYETGIGSNDLTDDFPELSKFLNYLKQTITALYSEHTLSDQYLNYKTHASIALVHGLICADLFWKIDSDSNAIMLNDTIGAFINSLVKPFVYPT